MTALLLHPGLELVFPLGVPGRRSAPSPEAGHWDRGAGSEPRHPSLTFVARPTLGLDCVAMGKARGVVGAGAGADARPWVSREAPQLSRQPTRPPRPGQTPSAGLRLAPLRGQRRPAAFPKGPIRSGGLARGSEERRAVGHRDAGLDLVGQFLWQPGGRGGREEGVRRGDTHCRRLGRGSGL